MAVVIFCLNDGDLWKDQQANMASPPDHRNWEPLREDLVKPRATDPAVCPLCGGPLLFK